MIRIADLNELYALVGRRVLYRGADYEIIEVLEDGPALVLECCAADAVIQTDQYGDARRRVPQTCTVPVLDADGTTPAPELLAMRVLPPAGG